MKVELNHEFPQISPQEWREQVEIELKGKGFDTLFTETDQGFTIDPIYFAPDKDQSTWLSTKAEWLKVSQWKEGSKVDFSPVDAFVLNAKENIEELPSKKDLFYTFKTTDTFVFKSNQKYLFDPFASLVFTGNWFNENQEQSLNDIKNAFQNNAHFCIDTSFYQNCGATEVQQLALLLLTVQEYIDRFGESVLSQLIWKNAVGGNFFIEIAKIRAAKLLLLNVYEEYETTDKIFVFSETSLKNKSLLDKYNNLIRTSLESIAAVLGGSDAVYTLSYDELFKNQKDSAIELAFKQQILMDKESHYSQFIDPLKGSFYIEALVRDLCMNAWDMFQAWEQEGGLLAIINNGTLQSAINNAKELEMQKFEANEINLVGVNLYPKQDETITKGEVKTFETTSVNKIVDTIKPFRLAEDIEKTKYVK